MQTTSQKFAVSSRNLRRHTKALFDATRQAFRRLGKDLLGASKAYESFLAREAKALWGFGQRRVERAVQTKGPSELERRTLASLHRTTLDLAEKLEARMSSLEDQGGLPLDGYEDLTARHIVAKLDELSPQQWRSVYNFERAHKARTTVLRAIEQRMAA